MSNDTQQQSSCKRLNSLFAQITLLTQKKRLDELCSPPASDSSTAIARSIYKITCILYRIRAPFRTSCHPIGIESHGLNLFLVFVLNSRYHDVHIRYRSDVEDKSCCQHSRYTCVQCEFKYGSKGEKAADGRLNAEKKQVCPATSLAACYKC